MKFTQNDILRTYKKIRKLSQRQISNGNLGKALRTIETAAKIAYQFNWRYADEELESQLQIISERMIQSEHLVPKPGRIIFYDSWGWDNRGLTQQYIRALKVQGIEFLFIFENETPEKSYEIRSELKTYGKCQIFSINQSLPLPEKLDTLYRRILIFQPEKILMHITPWAAEALTVFYALPTVCKYQINLTDHAFWLGTQCLDYCLEFRNYGCTVSLEKRGLTKNQLLLNPYYPITSGQVFLGFPKEVEHRVILFSGSSFYKIYGRDGAYFKLVKRLLEENPECILLFAGEGDGRKIRKFIAENKLENRFLLLGHRPDINEVFIHCDIYLSTYPICGALMSQLAAENSKPILAYTTPDIPSNYIEDLICNNQSISISLTNEDAFLKEAKKLIQNKEYRLKRGKELKNAMISFEEFNLNFKTLLKTNKNPFKFMHVNIDYNCFTSLHIEVENNYINTFKKILLKTFLFKLPFLFPIIFLKTILSFLLQGYSIKNNR